VSPSGNRPHQIHHDTNRRAQRSPFANTRGTGFARPLGVPPSRKRGGLAERAARRLGGVYFFPMNCVNTSSNDVTATISVEIAAIVGST
jgi:hypothetical protein